MQLYVGSEISGKHPDKAHIIEAAAVVMDDRGTEIASFATIVRPEDPMWVGIQASGLITADELRFALSEAAAAHAFRDFLDRHRAASIHAYGSRLAQGLFADEPWNVPAGRWSESICFAASAVMEYRGAGLTRWPRLAEAARFFEVAEPVARGLSRARATAAIHRTILSSFDQAEAEPYHFIEDMMGGNR